MSLTAYAVWATFAALQGPATTQTGPLTIDDAVALAQRQAFAVRLQQSTIERSRQAAIQSIGSLGPSVNTTVAYTRFGKESTASFGASSPPVVISPISSQSISLGLSLPIDIAGNMHRLARAAQYQYEASKTTLNGTLNDTKLSVRSAFLAVLRSKSQVEAYTQSLKDAQERFRQGDLQLKQQQVARVDVDRLDAAVAQAQSDLLVAQNTYQLAKFSFNLTLARPIQAPVDLQDVSDLPKFSGDVDGLADNAMKARPEVKSLYQQLHALSLITRATEAGLNPSLALSASYQRNLDASGLTAQDSTSTLALSLSVPIFDSGVTRAKVKQARQNEVALKIQLEESQLGISQEVRTAAATLENADARMKNAQRQLDLAQEVYRLSGIRQQQGEGSYIDVIDAETTLTQARTGLIAARYDYLTAYAQLQKAVGSDDLANANAGANVGAQGATR